ncbi:WYL domain-containing protein [Bizionia saleffrena]|uniref:WYL domain-containing protein n=1 Tax=Bizionia saleffrena TaxID=291189 RepID=A0A8H2LNZ0_9FLAO|nr:WYL domain-containing protein [Bizionia saleffrena]TYB77452.1 WYL domain-containing protein [Bizionia saleffrena]
MSNYKILKRLNCIVKLVDSYPGLNKTQILERLQNDYALDVAMRTFESDKRNLELYFGIAIMYNYKTRGYNIEESEDALNQFFKFAKFASMAEIYESGIKDYKAFQKRIIPEDSSGFSGVRHFKELIYAISLLRKVSFIKENYYGDTIKRYIVSPLCLKEYSNRWYLIAVAEGETQIRNFGIDRLSKIEILNSKSLKIEDFQEQLKQYDTVVGLNYSEYPNKKVENIVIKAHYNQLKYLRSLPLHKSQECVNGINNDWGTVTFKLKPNYEFEIQILKLGNMVEVLKPQWFRDKIKKHISEMYQLYN